VLKPWYLSKWRDDFRKFLGDIAMTDYQTPVQSSSESATSAALAQKHGHSPQMDHMNYRLAFQDLDFLLREDLRPVRFQLELLKPELLLNEHGIGSTVVFYGSARIPAPDQLEARIAAAQSDAERETIKRMATLSPYYEEARSLARRLSQLPQEDDQRHFVVMSGGGPSFMEAANRGAADVGALSIALNIVLPHEQAPNEYVTPALSFQFHYFALRKMHFLMRARALCVFPGGFGTLDELFEVLTLIQTQKIKRIPVLMFGKAFWDEIVNFEALAKWGTINAADLDLFRFVETADEAWRALQEHYPLL
jgi:uncharacterized protein (TIGR00730 family)